MIKKAVVSFLILALVFVITAAIMIATGHAEPSQNRKNSLGVLQTWDNPYTYLLALPIEGKEVEGGFTVRFWDFGMPAMIDHTVFFCDARADKFDGKKGVLVMVYETQAHHKTAGIGCHDLKYVGEVK
jgi:hypothetical protein